jgi:predicted ester cyclase
MPSERQTNAVILSERSESKNPEIAALTTTAAALGFPPTHKTVQCSGPSFMHMKNGKLHDAWNFFDFTTVIHQLRQA